MNFFNGGPGHAVVLSAMLRATFVNSDETSVQTEWLPPQAMRRLIAQRGLIASRDYELMWLGKGAPLVPCARASDGIELARFSRFALAHLSEFSIKIVVEDRVGDKHEREIDAYYHLPYEIKEAARDHRFCSAHP